MSEGRFQEMLDEYYQFRGWDHEGIPTQEKLKELSLGNIVEQLKRCDFRRIS
jgi:aldehyde:ferredoxin oxidoreductase